MSSFKSSPIQYLCAVAVALLSLGCGDAGDPTIEDLGPDGGDLIATSDDGGEVTPEPCDGSCDGPQDVCIDDECVCQPDCSGPDNSDGCGGQCCQDNAHPENGACECDSGYFPSFDGTACVKNGDACPSDTPPLGFCIDDHTWFHCDDRHGVQSISCGAQPCKTLASGQGACGCSGVLDENCGSLPFTDDNELLVTCAKPFNVMVLDNCKAITGRETAHCGTMVTAFGWATSCYCEVGYYWTGSRCERLGNYCNYDSDSSIYACY